jgi:hypothetical protein
VVTEGTEDEVESVCMFNHVVEYYARHAECQPFG